MKTRLNGSKMGASALKQLDMGDNGREWSQMVEVGLERLLFGENVLWLENAQ